MPTMGKPRARSVGAGWADAVGFRAVVFRTRDGFGAVAAAGFERGDFLAGMG